jgi:hypothetical protein
MSIKINIGVNKKIGLPDYGSAGSHCNIEIEADNSVLHDADKFLQRVQDAYELARLSVEQELAHHRQGNDRLGNTGQSRSVSPPKAETAPQRQEQRQEYRSDHSAGSSAGTRYVASDKQQRFIAALVKGIKGLDWKTLDRYCGVQFGKSPSQLTPKEASALIDDLKEAKEGRKEIAA